MGRLFSYQIDADLILDQLIRINTEQTGLIEPAVEFFTAHAAPTAGTFSDSRQNKRFQFGNNVCIRL